MELIEDRDPAFWERVYQHPEVKPHVGLGQDLDMAAALAHPGVTALRTENGGFLFLRLDALGRVQELHTFYTPEGWGREVTTALKAALILLFDRGAQIITTFEVEGYWRSRPPKSYRFEPCGDFAPVPDFNVSTRTWSLSRIAWEASPARQRMHPCLGH